MSDVPFDEEGDEIYVFGQRPSIGEIQVFINDGLFRLSEPKTKTKDWLGDNASEQRLQGSQLHFWHQLELLAAETYLGQGFPLIVASQKKETMNRLASEMDSHAT